MCNEFSNACIILKDFEVGGHINLPNQDQQGYYVLMRIAILEHTG